MEYSRNGFHFIDFLIKITITIFCFSCSWEDDNEKNEHHKQAFLRAKEIEDPYPEDRIEAASKHRMFLEFCLNGDKENIQNFKTKYCPKKYFDDLDKISELMQKYFHNREDFFYQPTGEIKKVVQICLVPGFFIRTCDSYTPIIAKCIKEIFQSIDKSTKIATTVTPRWDGSNLNHYDNTDFETQYKVLKRLIDEILEELREKYPNKPEIHLVFACESYGGKITLFFLNKFLFELKKDDKYKNVFIDHFITVHSPLYKMAFTQFIFDNESFFKKLWEHIGFTLLRPMMQTDMLDLLNIELYKTTYSILNESHIGNITTDDALRSLTDANINIVNFIGTPDDLIIGGTHLSYRMIKYFLTWLQRYFPFDTGSKYLLEKYWGTLNNTCETLVTIAHNLKSTQDPQISSIWTMLKPTEIGIFFDVNDTKDMPKTVQKLKKFLDDKNINDITFKAMDISSLFYLFAEFLSKIVPFLERNIFSSDLVVTVEETTQNQSIITEIQRNRNKVGVYNDGKCLTIINSPSIYHTGEHSMREHFNKELQTFFVPIIKQSIQN